jgi:hypothetical protein
MSFLASDLNFIFLFISLIYIFDYNNIRISIKDTEAAVVIAAAAARGEEEEEEGGKEGGGGGERGGDGDKEAANSDGDSDSGGVAKR